MITEADTCRKYVLPKLSEAGWARTSLSKSATSEVICRQTILRLVSDNKSKQVSANV
jgi:hypothetical protein